MSRQLPLKYGIFILIILHTVGVFGILSPYKDWFLSLTPVNLLITFFLLIYYQIDQKKLFYSTITIIFVSSYILEVIGVNIGIPFGDYAYGATLGPKAFGTPYLIGINWIFMSFCGALLMKQFFNSDIIRAFATGLLVTGIDYIIEPVAIELDFWTWTSNEIPIQNYITWWIFITLYAMLIYKLIPNTKNPIAKWVLAIQFLFFLSLFISIKS